MVIFYRRFQLWSTMLFLPLKLAFVWFLCLSPEYTRGCCLFTLVGHNDRLGPLRGERGPGGCRQRDGEGRPPGPQWIVAWLTDGTHGQLVVSGHFTGHSSLPLYHWSGHWTVDWWEGSDWLDIMILRATSGQQHQPHGQRQTRINTVKTHILSLTVSLCHTMSQCNVTVSQCHNRTTHLNNSSAQVAAESTTR